jgi:hypothetical protein
MIGGEVRVPLDHRERFPPSEFLNSQESTPAMTRRLANVLRLQCQV